VVGGELSEHTPRPDWRLEWPPVSALCDRLGLIQPLDNLRKFGPRRRELFELRLTALTVIQMLRTFGFLRRGQRTDEQLLSSPGDGHGVFILRLFLLSQAIDLVLQPREHAAFGDVNRHRVTSQFASLPPQCLTLATAVTKMPAKCFPGTRF